MGGAWPHRATLPPGAQWPARVQARGGWGSTTRRSPAPRGTRGRALLRRTPTLTARSAVPGVHQRCGARGSPAPPRPGCSRWPTGSPGTCGRSPRDHARRPWACGPPIAPRTRPSRTTWAAVIPGFGQSVGEIFRGLVVWAVQQLGGQRLALVIIVEPPGSLRSSEPGRAPCLSARSCGPAAPAPRAYAG